MKTALIHDFLFEYAGSERVLEQILQLFPEADLYAVIDFLRPEERQWLGGKKASTTFVQKFPLLRRNPPRYLPLAVPWMPLAIEQLDLSGYDLILSSSHSVAKGVLVSPGQLHLAYVHSPMRYAWDLQEDYLRHGWLSYWPFNPIARVIFSYLRLWDARTANGVDYFLANSEFVAGRIWRTYRREAQVIYPPVDVSQFALQTEKQDYYLVVSRLVPYKRVDLVVEAFKHLPDKHLVIIGDGPERKRLANMAGINTQILGYQPRTVVMDAMRGARAMIMAGVEDFGIAPVEAQASGTPVIAYGQGGAKETIQGLDHPKPTGVFFGKQDVDHLLQATHQFESEEKKIHPENCRENALRFSPEEFRTRYLRAVSDAWALHTGSAIPLRLMLAKQEALRDG